MVYQNILRVRPSVRPKRKWAWFFVKSGYRELAARYVRHATVGACRRTSNRQEHKIIQRAGPEQDTIFHLHVTACRRRGSHRQDERLAWVASRGQGTSCSSSFVSKVLGANFKRANNLVSQATPLTKARGWCETTNNFLPVAQKFTMCTDRVYMCTILALALTGSNL